MNQRIGLLLLALCCVQMALASRHRYRCKVPRAPRYGSVRSNGRGRFVYVNEKIWFSCDNGFQLGGSKAKDVTCLATGWSHPFPTCEEIPRCKVPRAPRDGSVRADERGAKYVDVGDKIWFKCDSGFKLGGSRRKDIECTEDGWEHDFPTCDEIPRQCRIPPPPPNGSVRSKKKGAKYVDVGQKIWFACDNGYQLVGRKDIECLTSGFEHDAPTCQEIPRQCRIPPPPPNGSVRSKKRGAKYVNVGQKIWFACDNGFQLVGRKDIECLTSGFEHDAPTCQRTRGGSCKGKCRRFGLVPHGGCRCGIFCRFRDHGCCSDYKHYCGGH